MQLSRMRTLKIVVLIFLTIIFAYKIFTFIDPDLGWHLRAGEIVTVTGSAPHTDPWTYTMAGNEWINHEWLLDAVLWRAWSNGAWQFVGIFFLLITLIPFIVWIQRVRYYTEIIFILLGGYMMLGIAGIRPQILSFFLFFIVWEIIRTRFIYQYRSKIFYLLPLIFLIWANIHAGFVAGLGILGITVLFEIYCEIWKGRNITLLRNPDVSLYIFVVSCVASLWTPYGIDLWIEIYRSTLTPLIGEIGEWKSAFSSWGVIYPLFVGLIVGLTVALRNKLNRFEIFIVLLFILTSAKHARMLPMLLIVAMPFIAVLHDEFYKFANTSPEGKLVKRTVFPLTIISFVIIFFFTMRNENILHPYHPPFDAIRIESVLRKSTSGNTFNDYNLGGGMIFFDPSRKLFIDGRLPHWRNTEGYSAFEEYLDVTYVHDHWKNVFRKYDIQLVILGHESEEYISTHKIFDEIKRFGPIMQRVLLFILPDKAPILLHELLDNGWCRVYQDTEATILASPDTTLCK